MVTREALAAGPRVARPASLAEIRDVVRESAAAGERVLVRGGGTAQQWGAPVTGTELVLDMSSYDEVIERRPSDMTVAVRAGMPLARLQRLLAADGQWLAYDPPGVTPHGPRAAATLGGLLATGDAGPSRLRHGTLRDLVIGATVVLPDGLIGRSGGHVIKNVAGYDIAKLFHGSLGTLGVVAELVLRVHPRPPASRTVAVGGVDAAGARRLAVALLRSPYEPTAIEWLAGPGRLLARFDGPATGVVERSAGARELLAGHPVQGVAGIAELSDDEAATAWLHYARDAVGDPVAYDETVARAAIALEALSAVAERLARIAADSGVHHEFVAGPGHGVCVARIFGGDVVGHAGALRVWRDEVERRGGTVTVCRRVEGLEDIVSCWGTPPGAVRLMRQVARAFDPERRFAPGRFAPWW